MTKMGSDFPIRLAEADSDQILNALGFREIAAVSQAIDGKSVETPHQEIFRHQLLFHF